MKLIVKLENRKGKKYISLMLSSTFFVYFVITFLSLDILHYSQKVINITFYFYLFLFYYLYITLAL